MPTRTATDSFDSTLAAVWRVAVGDEPAERIHRRSVRRPPREINQQLPERGGRATWTLAAFASRFFCRHNVLGHDDLV